MITAKKYARGKITVDVDAIAQGIYDEVLGTEYEGALGFGMLPAPMMGALESQLKEKFPDKVLMIGDELFEPEDMRQVRRDMVRDISAAVYQIATDSGLMVV